MVEMNEILGGRAPHESMSARELARETDTAPSTASRFKKGDHDGLRMDTMRKYIPFARSCPLCGTEADPSAQSDHPSHLISSGPVGRLDRFLNEIPAIDVALAELEYGRKEGHWMWFVFPQAEGLGYSQMSMKYALRSADEVADYIQNPELGARYRYGVETIVNFWERGGTLEQVIPDELDRKKLQSSLTLIWLTLAALGIEDAWVRGALLDLFDDRKCGQTMDIFQKWGQGRAG